MKVSYNVEEILNNKEKYIMMIYLTEDRIIISSNEEKAKVIVILFKEAILKSKEAYDKINKLRNKKRKNISKKTN